MKYRLKILNTIFLVSIIYNQTVYEQTLYENGEELDVFAYQIPENFNSEMTYPLLIAFHQWGGSHMSTFSTTFDEESNTRDWIFMSPFGGSSNNYNHQEAQYMVKKAVEWLFDNYNIDENKIYAVGGSMGGASGMIYANNHLNPNEPMIAATASASGILDCERRAIEMDGNNSMIEWFGGNYDEFPFEYHRNSAIYFADSTQSMHYNLQYTPLYFDFGVTEPHRTHAEDMYEVMNGYNSNMWIDEEPTGSHGFTVFDENHVCNWLSQFELIDDPNAVNVNLDEPSRAYWIEAKNQLNDVEFIRINANRNDNNNFSLYELSNSDSIIFHNTIDINNTELLINHEFINNDYYIGLSGNDINFINEINATGISDNYSESLNINIQNEIAWISIPNSVFDSIGIIISYSPTDINQDGIWDILDIVLTVNFIMEGTEPTESQFEAADLNDDGIINILDVVALVNIILGN